jgi:mitogen-activated protein kinase 1/3
MQQHINTFVADCLEHRYYKLLSVLGKGSYGIVFSAEHRPSGKLVAIKQLNNVGNNISDVQRTLREVRFSRFFNHVNIVKTFCMLTPRSMVYFRRVYLVMEKMDTNLSAAIKVNVTTFTTDHHRFILFQLLNSLRCLHDLNLFHRDLKPANVLINKDCMVKLCDFGLSRLARDGYTNHQETMWTTYVCTRWYRAPELLCCDVEATVYTKQIDMWSVGCIFAEIIMGHALFMGDNEAHQLQVIADMIGRPKMHVQHDHYSEKARAEIMKSCNSQNRLGSHFHGRLEPQGIDLLSHLLDMNPETRCKVHDAMKHPYFDSIQSTARKWLPEFDQNHVRFDEEKYVTEPSTVMGVKALIYRQAESFA